MPARKLKQFLDEKGVRYVSIRHSPAYTAQETAASAHIPGRELAKTVVLHIDGTLTIKRARQLVCHIDSAREWIPAPMAVLADCMMTNRPKSRMGNLLSCGGVHDLRHCPPGDG